MTDQTPRFEELVDRNDPECARLLAAHTLLVACGAPPELPPSLLTAPSAPHTSMIGFPRRRFTAIAALASAAVVLFGVGYAIGGRDRADTPVRTIAMTGAGGARASIALLSSDAAGNWPMTLSVTGLPPLPAARTYTLWLTRRGELAKPCGTFVVAAGTTEVPLNAPFPLKQFDGWVVVRSGTTQPFLLRTGSV